MPVQDSLLLSPANPAPVKRGNSRSGATGILMPVQDSLLSSPAKPSPISRGSVTFWRMKMTRFGAPKTEFQNFFSPCPTRTYVFRTKRWDHEFVRKSDVGPLCRETTFFLSPLPLFPSSPLPLYLYYTHLSQKETLWDSRRNIHTTGEDFLWWGSQT